MTSTTDPTPLIVLSFNRPDYLARTLESIKGQVGLAGREIHLFQDGAINFFSGEQYAEQADIDGCVAVFKQAFPMGFVHSSPDNVGIGLNFERAEQHIFQERRAEAAIMLEDDMILSDFYVETMDRMLGWALDHPKSLIGHVAAYGDHRATREAQAANENKIVLMGHAWGYGITRRHWLDQREILEPYVELLRNCDYKKRPRLPIGQLFASLGLASTAMSQDALKHVATVYLGRARIMPFVCRARYIGERGSNFTPEDFARLGYGREQIFEKPPSALERPSDQELIGFINGERQRFACQAADHVANLPPPTHPFLPIDRPAILPPRKKLQIDKQHFLMIPDSRYGRETYKLTADAFAIAKLTEAAQRGPVRVIVGAGQKVLPGWCETNASFLSLTDVGQWEFYFGRHGVERVLLEHGIDDLTSDQFEAGLRNVYRFLIPGGALRIAVPDGYFPDQEYLDRVRPAGASPDAREQTRLWDIDTLSSALQRSGFSVVPLEHFTRAGEFVEHQWSAEDGPVSRSRYNDRRNKDGVIKYTSLLVDAVKSDRVGHAAAEG